MTTDRPPATPRARTLTIIAQDPAVTDADGRILRARIEVPAEVLAAGPWGHRVQIIDYDASTHTLYAPRDDGYGEIEDGSYVDPYRAASDEQLLGDPQFHAQNVYAIAMRTLATFEKARKSTLSQAPSASRGRWWSRLSRVMGTSSMRQSSRSEAKSRPWWWS